LSSQAWINVKDFGAEGDTKKVPDGEIHVGTTVLKSATANFVANDTGKSIYIEGADL
jgi:hypothetical protein